MSQTVFLAGGTSFTARFVLAQPTQIRFRLHVRPGSPNLAQLKDDERTVIADIDDPDALAAAMAGADAVLSLIGTLRTRFKAENVSYDSVDFGVNKRLVDAACRAGVRRFVLMSSHGAGSMPGAYMAAKRRAERYLIESGLQYAIVRPSFLVGGERRFVPGADALLSGLGRIPGLRGLADDWRPIPLELLAWNFIRLVESDESGAILSGRELWRAWRERSIPRD